MSEIVEDEVKLDSSNIDDAAEHLLQEWLERKIPVLPQFPADRQLEGSSNYGIWKVLMEAVLETHDLVSMVSTAIARPAGVKEGSQWDRLNARIRSFIFLNCTPSVIGHIKSLTGARQIWLRLGELFNRMTPMKRIAIEVQMRTLDPAKSPSMREHINKLQAMQQEVEQAGKKISSEDMAITLLSHLTPIYSAFYSSLITSGRMTDLTWEELVPMVLDQEDRFASTSEGGGSEALTGQASRNQKKKGNKKQSDGKKEKTCYKCNKPGHLRKDCPDESTTQEEKGDSSDAGGAVARTPAFLHVVASEQISFDETGLIVPRVREWIVDSGASRHMSPSTEGLQNLQDIGGQIVIGDGSAVPICGIGDLSLIPNSTGGLYTSQILYVPDLGFHLLSVKELCKLGLLVEFSEEQFWIRDRQTRHVVCEGIEEHGVYKLKDPVALAHYLPSPTIDADLDFVVHEQHVPDEGETDQNAQGSVVGEWLQEYLQVNYGLIALEDRELAQGGVTHGQEVLRKSSGEACGGGVLPWVCFLDLCFLLLVVLGRMYLALDSGAWNGPHRSAGDLQFYIHRENDLGTVIVGDLIGSDGGFDHIRTTSQSGTSECEMWHMGFGRRQIQRGIGTSPNCQDCNPSSSSMAWSGKLSTIWSDELMDASGYWELGGSLIRIKVCLPVGLWTWLMSEPYKTHWQTDVCILLRYWTGDGDNDPNFRGWKDSTWTGELAFLERLTVGHWTLQIPWVSHPGSERGC